MNQETQARQFAICISDEGCDDLQVLKVYQILPDDSAAEEKYVRVIDDSGEDYLYPFNCFIKTEFDEIVAQKLSEVLPSAA